MARTVVFDELIVTVRVPAGLPGPAAAAAARAMKGRAFAARLRAAVTAAFRADPSLAAVTVRIGR